MDSPTKHAPWTLARRMELLGSSREVIEVLKQSGYTVADWIERRNAGAVLLQLQ